ncbi:MAG TPA: 2Fe-2S iron-sulfur cluster-binding protein, partial [Candidatus Nitrosotalea sp.]|nr:2Fe-2S iron-sulfur cluster-binding protein [Candidatus Nitrosotalea sp.]
MAVVTAPNPSEELISIGKTSTQSDTVILRIARSNPAEGQETTFSEFKVPVKKWTTVLEAILYVKQNLDHAVAVRYSCRQASCGSCGMKINGKPGLACYTKVSELKSNIITVEPMNNFPIIRDLAVDFKQLISNHKKVKP